MSTAVNVDNFVRAETDRMFSDLQRDAGGVNVWNHSRAPAAIDRQTVIRMNRDTLYSFAIVDISDGATFTIPDAGPARMAGEGALTVNVPATGSNSQVVSRTLSIVDVSNPPWR